MNLQFANPWVLYLLWLVPALGAWWYTVSLRQERNLATFISASMQKKLCEPSAPTQFVWQAGLITAGIFLALIAVARPQWGMKEETVYRRGRDLIIALDVSRSMLANDVHPSRLQRAKADIVDLVKELRGDRAALVAFRRKAILLCPLTTDYAYVMQSLDAVSIDSAPRGETDIGDAISKALDAFESDEGSHKAIILISDGEDLTGSALTAAQKAGEKNIPIFTVGLGNRQGAKIPDQDNPHTYLSYKGKDVITKLDHETLYAIAKTTGGAYVPVETASMTSTTLGTLYRDHLRKISVQDLEETLQRRYVERYQLFLLPAMLLLLTGTFLSKGRLAASRRRTSAMAGQGDQRSEIRDQPPPKNLNPPKQDLKNLVILMALFMSVLNSVLNATATTNEVANTSTNSSIPKSAIRNPQSAIPIPPGREGARIAQKLYILGKYDQSAETYLESAKGATRKSQCDFRYNAAAALFKAGKYKESADILRELMQSEQPGQPAVPLALGSALYRASQISKEPGSEQAAEKARLLREAGEAFKEAARSQTDSDSARHNLAVVLEALPKAEEQAKIAKLMAEYEQIPAFQIANEMLTNQRKLIEGIAAVFTNNSPEQVSQLEGLAEKQKVNADLWIPLKGKLLSALTQQGGDPNTRQQAAVLEQLIETTRDNMNDTAASLRDLDVKGHNSAIISEAGAYQLWKCIAPYHCLLQEDLSRQTNAISMTTMNGNPQSIQAQQEEALDLTRLFVKRFSEAAPAGGTVVTGDDRDSTPTPAPGGVNSPLAPHSAGKSATETNNTQRTTDNGQLTNNISAETRQKILELADWAIAAQEGAAKLLKENKIAESLADQQRSYDLLKEIEKLLPKDQDKSKGSFGQDQKREQEKQEEEQKKDDQQQKEDQKQKESPRQQPQPEPEARDPAVGGINQRLAPPQAGSEVSDQEKREEEKQETPPEDVQKLLEKAIQREREHETEKRSRNRFVPLSPLDRDW